MGPINARRWGKEPPPKNCPVCRQVIWTSLQARNVYEEWAFNKSHLHTSHPEYEVWNRRASWIYLVPIALIILPLGVGVAQIVPVNVTPLVFEVLWASALVMLFVVFTIKDRGKSRFRKLWKDTHPGSVTPL